MFIKEVRAELIKNSRGEKTVKVNIKTLRGSFASSAPSGKSVGKYEVSAWSHSGVGFSFKMLKAFGKILEKRNFMIKNLDGLKELNELIHKFESRHGLFGANATYALETAFLKAAAKENKKELWKFIADSIEGKGKIPMPVGNCIGGGKHSEKLKGARPDFQEFLLIPKEKTFARAVTKIIRAHEYAKVLLKKKEGKFFGGRIKNDEGAWHTNLTNEKTLEVLCDIKKKFKLGIGLDVAGSSFFKKGYYNYKNKNLVRDKLEQVDFMQHLIKKFGIFYVEDLIQEEDFTGFLGLRKDLGLKISRHTLIVGDDLTVTNLHRVRRAIRDKAINAVIVKPNQNGHISEVAKVVAECKKSGVKIIFSHRSGETMDIALADYAVGFGADFIKCGIFGRERLVKLRRVMEIEKSWK